MNAVDGPVVLVTKPLHTLKAVRISKHKINTSILYKMKSIFTDQHIFYHWLQEQHSSQCNFENIALTNRVNHDTDNTPRQNWLQLTNILFFYFFIYACLGKPYQKKDLSFSTQGGCSISKPRDWMKLFTLQEVFFSVTQTDLTWPEAHLLVS